MTDHTRVAVSDWIKIGVLLLGLGVGYGALRSQLNDITRMSSAALLKSGRIERYLSSKDAKYWETVSKQDPHQPPQEDSDPK